MGCTLGAKERDALNTLSRFHRQTLSYLADTRQNIFLPVGMAVSSCPLA